MFYPNQRPIDRDASLENWPATPQDELLKKLHFIRGNDLAVILKNRFILLFLILLEQLGTTGRTLRKSISYSSITIAVIILSFSLVYQAFSQSENLKVLNYSWYIDSIGGFDVVGEVQNVGSTILDPVVLGGTVYTPDGVAQALSNPCIVYVENMLPHQKAPFLMEFRSRDLSWLSQGVDHIDFEVVQANVTSKYQYPDLAITSSALSTDVEGVYWINGNVQNTGNKTATNVRVIATFYNASNVVVAAGYSNTLSPISLSPSGIASFKVGAFDVNKTETTPERQISSYTLIVQTEGPLLTGTPPWSNSYSSSNFSSTPPQSSPDSSSDDGSSNSAAPDYLRYVALVAIVIVAIGVLVVYNKRRKSKASSEKSTKSQSVGKRKQPNRKRYRNV
jgi:hypothetical protein